MDQLDNIAADLKRPQRKAWLRPLKLLLAACGLYVLLCVMLGLIQRTLIYQPRQAANIDVGSTGLPAGALSEIVTTADDGVELNGWRFAAPRAHASSPAAPRSRAASPSPVVLYFSGNAGHRLYRVPECGILTSQGADVLLFDYRGYGDNAGKPSEEVLAADARVVWRYAVEERRIAPERIVLYGESLGGGVAVRLAAEMCAAGTPPGGLIVRSTFSSLTDAAAYHFPWLPVRWLLVERYPSDERIGAVTCPILMLHGDNDRIVPIEQGRRLFAAARKESASGVAKRFVELRGANHNGVMVTHNEEMQSAVGGFFKEAGLLPQR